MDATQQQVELVTEFRKLSLALTKTLGGQSEKLKALTEGMEKHAAALLAHAEAIQANTEALRKQAAALVMHDEALANHTAAIKSHQAAIIKLWQAAFGEAPPEIPAGQVN